MYLGSTQQKGLDTILLISQVNLLMGREVSRRFGISYAGFQALLVIGCAKESVTIYKLARILGKQNHSTTVLINRLKAKDLVECNPYLALTESGSSLLDDIISSQMINDVFHKGPPRRFIQGLESIRAHLMENLDEPDHGTFEMEYFE